ncbi:MAG: (2Fe-2S) ferredoxin domain-containing protein [Bacteroidales bacterium]|jgi:NADP-reducing hydrogenase subunit HndB|nr:(2Fe-2S) ferredoxin domain-containing protein [Bacteroidales bacterium]MDD4703778.1 (2Fe-2S) ferredoxin domain-containing protein [Bacteroidales bacterium]
MTKIKSLADLKAMKQSVQEKIDTRAKGTAEGLVQVKVAMATCGIAAGAKKVMDYMMSETEKRGMDVVFTQTGCMGYCHAEPTIEVTLPGNEPIVFGYVDLKKADEIIDKYIKDGELVEGIIPVNYEKINN